MRRSSERIIIPLVCLIISSIFGDNVRGLQADGLTTSTSAVKQEESKVAGQTGTSVNPGINDSFLDPELDVGSFIERFEVESREIFLCREKILAACEIKPGMTVADVGAGTGLFTHLFVDAVGPDGWVFAVDIAPGFVEHINRTAHKAGRRNITGVLCMEDSVNLPPNSVDVVFICDTYHHFEYPEATMSSIHRALREDGHMILIDFERIPGKSREWLLGHVRAGKEVFVAEIRDAGFVPVEEKGIEGFEENYFIKFRRIAPAR